MSLARIACSIRAARPAPAALPASTRTRSGGSTFGPSPSTRISISPVASGRNPATTSLTADGHTLTPRRISMSSVRPMQRSRGPVQPQPQGPVFTMTRSRVRKRSIGLHSRSIWVKTSSPSISGRSGGMTAPVSGSTISMMR